MLILRGDFTVQWYHHHNSTCSVFLLLHHMAIVLLEKSIAIYEKVQGKSKVPVSTIYQRIFWGKHSEIANFLLPIIRYPLYLCIYNVHITKIWSTST